MVRKSMLDCAYEILKNSDKPISFKELVELVSKELEMSKEEVDARISQFYTNLSLDGRFVVLQDNYWELRERVPFEKVHIDMNDAYNDVEEAEEDEDDKEKELGEDSEESLGDFDTADEVNDASTDEVKKELGV